MRLDTLSTTPMFNCSDSRNQMGLREEDSMKAFLGFKLRVERISVAIVHLYCTFCEQNKVYIWTQEENLSKKSG